MNNIKPSSEDYKKIRDSWVEFTKKPRDIPEVVKAPTCRPKQGFQFYWLEIVESSLTHPGLLYMFGKSYDYIAKAYVSCAVAVKYCHKRYYLLPREHNTNRPSQGVSFNDVYDEFTSKVPGDFEFKDCQLNMISKKYAFDSNIPFERDYVEVKCKAGSFQYLKSVGDTYSRILGSSIKYTDTFFLERGIVGPCWLLVDNYTYSFSKATNCKIEIECTNIDNITPLTDTPFTPPVTLMSLVFQTVVKHQNSEKETIVCCSCFVDETSLNEETTIKEHFAIMLLNNKDYTFEDVECAVIASRTQLIQVYSEGELVTTLFDKIKEHDPDILYGEDIKEKVELLHKWIKEYNLEDFRVKLPKVILKKIPAESYFMDIVQGRVLCDTKILAAEMIDKTKTHALNELAGEVLKLPYFSMPAERIISCLDNINMSSELIITTMWGALCLHKLMTQFNMLEHIVEIATLCGTTLNKTCEGFVTRRCEPLLLRAFHAENFILPDSQNGGKSDIAGGLVLEPCIGMYQDFILTLDFRALYPSIILEYNLCHTTMTENGPRYSSIEDKVPLGILPKVVKNLMNKRSQILDILPTDNEDRNKELSIRQETIKKITNSLFGYLCYDKGRFYADYIAAAITAKGREILKNTERQIKLMSLRPIYGDTDSIMIDTRLRDYDAVKYVSANVQAAINFPFKNIVLKEEAIFRPFYLLKKKQYVGINHLSNENCVQVVKGLEMVKRDCPVILRDVSEKILNFILNNETDQICRYLLFMKKDLKANYKQYHLGSFTITKKLGKNPNQYNKASHVDVVQVALKYNSTRPKKLKAGDYVTFVICKDDTKKNPLDRMYHIDDFQQSNTLEIDVDYYITEYIYPTVLRLCAPLKAIIKDEDIERALICDIQSEPLQNEQPQAEQFHSEAPPAVPKKEFFVLYCNVCGDEIHIIYDAFSTHKACKCPPKIYRNVKERLENILDNISANYMQNLLQCEHALYIIAKLKTELQQNCTLDELETFVDELGLRLLISSIDMSHINLGTMFASTSKILKE